MVPAASYSYDVFDNEASFQCVMLDALGDHELAAEYLEAFLRLQGSKPFQGTYTGDQKAVYHGARVDPEYDYTAAEYNLDHGTVLWALGEHYFYTRDKQWLRHAAPSMKRAADWVIEQRKLTELIGWAGAHPGIWTVAGGPPRRQFRLGPLVFGERLCRCGHDAPGRGAGGHGRAGISEIRAGGLRLHAGFARCRAAGLPSGSGHPVAQ